MKAVNMFYICVPSDFNYHVFIILIHGIISFPVAAYQNVSGMVAQLLLTKILGLPNSHSKLQTITVWGFE
jgi:hypothetical protein